LLCEGPQRKGPTMSKRPWFKFHPQDWLADPHLRMCSPPAQGLLINLMALAHINSEPGYLGAIDKQNAGRALAWNGQTVSKAWAELEQNGRIARADNGQWCIPRMVRDNEYSNKQAEYGKQGGNPTLKAPLKPEQSRADKETDAEESRYARKGFPEWSLDDFEHSVAAVNMAGALTDQDIADFVAHWTQPTPSGAMGFQEQRQWDTRTRLEKWVRVKMDRKTRGKADKPKFVSSIPE